MLKNKLFLIIGLSSLLIIPSFENQNIQLKAEDEIAYSADFEGITINSSNPPDKPTGFVWAQDYLNCKTEFHNGSNMLYATAASKENDFSSIGGFGTASKSNLAKLKEGEPYQVDCYLEYFNMDFIEVEFLGGSDKWGAARLYKDSYVRNDNGGNNMTDVSYKNNILSFKFTYSFNINENVNGYITFKAFNSNNGYCYFDNITIRHVDNQIEGTFDEYPLGTFDGTASDQYKTIIYCQTNDMTSNPSIIDDNGNNKLKISYTPTKVNEGESVFYFNKMQFMNKEREYEFSFDLEVNNISKLYIIYGGTWISERSEIVIDFDSLSTTINGTIFSSANYANNKLTMKYTVPSWSADYAQMVIIAEAKEIKEASLIIDNTKMTMTPIIQSLEVDVSEGKTTFNFGDQFSSEGIKIYVIYSNGDKYQIENSQCVFEGFDNATEGKQIITVSYENVSTTYQIEVNRVPSYLKLDISNVKLSYGFNEPLDFSNLIVELVYVDEGENKVLAHDALREDGYAIFTSGYNPLKEGTYTIIVIYKNLVATFEVSVEFDLTVDFEDIIYEGTGN